MDTNLGIHRNQQVRVTGTIGQSFNILFVDAQPADVELQVTGFSSRFADEVELQPRFPDDIRPDH